MEAGLMRSGGMVLNHQAVRLHGIFLLSCTPLVNFLSSFQEYAYQKNPNQVPVMGTSVTSCLKEILIACLINH